MTQDSGKAKTENLGSAMEQDLEGTFPDPTRLFKPYKVASVTSSEVIVAFDTNALLLPYKISQDDLQAIADVYKKLKSEKRIVLPARVARELLNIANACSPR
jgi:hypothetical protein